MQYLRTVLYNLRIYQERSGCNDTLPLEVIKSYIAKELEREKSPYGYLSGGITFCSMLPMRAVPFPVVCLLGMEDGSFPRPDIAFSFDRMAREPRLGDRSRRDDDRYLFLEAFLSARKQFYISFVGQSVRDDSKLPPSVLVSELLEYVGKISRDQAHDNVMCDDLIKRHRLQPFNPEYFSSEHVFSYNTIHCQAAEMLQRGPDPDAGFWHDMPLPLPEEDFFQLDLNDFLLFVTHPVRFFCNRRLGLILSESKKSIEDDEPLKIEGLEKYILSEDVVDLLLAQKKKEMIRPILKSKGLLPHGRVGEVESDDLIDEVSLFVDRFKTMADVQHVPVDLHIQCGDYKVYGQLPGLREKGLFFTRCAVVKGKDLLLGWISHLLLNCQAEQDRELPRETFIFGKDTQFKFKAVTSPYPLLQQILDLYRQGVQEPLPFFAETSYVFAKEMLKGDKVKAHKKAREKWQGGYNSRGECEDIYLFFKYAGQFPRDSEFEEYALAMYHPLFEYLEEEETA
jgi:exodeoxyribonuclease V gamma subunit